MALQLDTLPVWERMGTITLDEMDSIKLMNRIDTKFVTTERMLCRILDEAADRYRVLVTENERISPYDSLYYDTASLDMYTDHHNGRLVRQKIRTRTYLNSNLTFLEIKRKNNKRRTKKKRMVIPRERFTDFASIPEAVDFVAAKSRYTADMLAPRLSTRFRRITLVNRAKTERLTIDTALHFTNYDTGKDVSLGDAVIIELKQDGRCYSDMVHILSSLRVKPLRVSKYAIGTALTNPDVKSNRFKIKIRQIEKITDKQIYY